MENKILIYDNSLYDAKNGILRFNPVIDINRLRSSILYWDKIVLPSARGFIINNTNSHSIQEIESAGLLERIYTERPNSGEMAESLYNAHIDLMIKLFSDKKHNYTACDVEGLFIGKEDIKINGGELLHLVNAIPQPSDNVSISEILEFKEKRHDQLRLLMTHLNSLQLRIITAENKETELKKCINEIDKSCSDIIRLYNERKIQFNLANARFNFSMKEIIKYGGGTYTTAKTLGLPETASVIAGMVAGISIGIEIKDAISFKRIDKSNPFNYVGEISVRLS